MSDLIDDPMEGQNAPEFSVSEISGVVKRMIEGEFSHVRIRGEIGRVSRPASGHLYLDLKDDKSVLSGIIWKGVAARLRTLPEEGMEVIATGKLTTFSGQSKYQMIIENISPAGVGALMAMLEKRKKALASEGLFDADRKKTIPYLPSVIGVVTSPSGAVIRDILHRLRDRFARQVVIWPVPVQGKKCASSVADAITGFNLMKPNGRIPRPDLIIVARGGGSLEDLWGFNEEVVVRAVAASDIPLISAVGHETDTTLIDYVADLRAPTPTAAAEYAVPVRADLLVWLTGMEERRLRSLSVGINARRQRLIDIGRGLPNPAELIGLQAQRFDILAGRLPRGLHMGTQLKRTKLVQMIAGLRVQDLKQNIIQKKLILNGFVNEITHRIEVKIEKKYSQLSVLGRVHETLGYKATLKRGYAVLRDENKRLISRVVDTKSIKGLDVELYDGRIQFKISQSIGKVKPLKKAPLILKDQGNLF